MTSSGPRPNDVPGWVGLLVVLLDGCPRLPDAACRGHIATFDRARGDLAARAEAIDVCHGCVELAACRRWAESLPRTRHTATVIAGQYRSTSGRPVVTRHDRATSQ